MLYVIIVNRCCNANKMDKFDILVSRPLTITSCLFGFYWNVNVSHWLVCPSDLRP